MICSGLSVLKANVTFFTSNHLWFINLNTTGKTFQSSLQLPKGVFVFFVLCLFGRRFITSRPFRSLEWFRWLAPVVLKTPKRQNTNKTLQIYIPSSPVPRCWKDPPEPTQAAKLLLKTHIHTHSLTSVSFRSSVFLYAIHMLYMAYRTITGSRYLAFSVTNQRFTNPMGV